MLLPSLALSFNQQGSKQARVREMCSCCRGSVLNDMPLEAKRLNLHENFLLLLELFKLGLSLLKET